MCKLRARIVLGHGASPQPTAVPGLSHLETVDLKSTRPQEAATSGNARKERSPVEPLSKHSARRVRLAPDTPIQSSGPRPIAGLCVQQVSRPPVPVGSCHPLPDTIEVYTAATGRYPSSAILEQVQVRRFHRRGVRLELVAALCVALSVPVLGVAAELRRPLPPRPTSRL